MSATMERRYQERLDRYVTAMRNGKPDCVPIRPFVAEFTARHAGMTCEEVTHDYRKAFLAARKTAADFDWDAVVGNMVYVWTGLTQALGLKYYGIPGIDVPPDTGFQYCEPSEDHAFMQADEYDELIRDPNAFLYNVWLPRVSADIPAPGRPATYRGTLALVKGSMAMLDYFYGFGTQAALLRQESGTVSAIAGILKAPLDILADKLRGYIGLTMDLLERPDKVLAACEALMPHLLNVAQSTADPARLVPVTIWMHRGCVPFVSADMFESHYWPTLRPIIEELWRGGRQTLFYAEGKWDRHLDRFAELPDRSIVYHVDRGDLRLAHRKLHHKFCLSGGIPNFLLAFRSPEEVRECVRTTLRDVAADGGYILDAGAIMQNEIRPENLRAMTEAGREFGAYSDGRSEPAVPPADAAPKPPPATPATTVPPPKSGPRAGLCIPWEQKLREIPQVTGDPLLFKRIWEEVEGWGSTFIWQVLLSF